MKDLKTSPHSNSETVRNEEEIIGLDRNIPREIYIYIYTYIYINR